MIGDCIIVNGRLEAPAAAAFTLDDTDATYGYGCYETLKIRGGVLYFPEFHEERLLGSAAILGIETGLQPGDVVQALELLKRANRITDCNVKIMVIGREGRLADWYAFLLPPVVPPAAAYSSGVACLLYRGERHFPRAKSLSMLLSTVAYRAATARGCYDALLVNGRGEITEGTRTNVFYVISGESGTVYTPPAADALLGITRRTLIAALADAGMPTVERPLPVGEALSGSAGLMVTSTSSRVIPVSALLGSGNDAVVGPPLASISEPRADIAIAPGIAGIRSVYDRYLERYAERAGLEP